MKMKITHLALCVTLASGLACSAFSAARSDDSPAKMYRVSEVSVPGYPLIQTGTTLNAVRNAMGSPDEQLSSDLWLYHRNQSSSPQVQRDGCDELVIAFENDCVSTICRVNRRARGIVIARINAGMVANDQALAAVDLTKDPTLLSEVKK